MDDRQILESIYSTLKKIKGIVEYSDIVNDIESIDMTAKFGSEQQKSKLYDDLYNKYKNKYDWEFCGAEVFQIIYKRVHIVRQVNKIESNNTNNLLYSLRGWLIRYLAYKVCKDKWEEKVEELFLEDNQKIKNEQVLSNTMINLDGKILETILEHKNYK